MVHPNNLWLTIGAVGVCCYSGYVRIMKTDVWYRLVYIIPISSNHSWNY